MKKNLLLFGLLSILIWSCGKDDGPTPPKNNAPTIEADAYTVAENIDADFPIGEVVAEDLDTDVLTYTITANSNDLFEIGEATGIISLKAGKSLNFDIAQSHKIKVTVSDGEDEASAKFTINVKNFNIAGPVMENQAFEVLEDITPSEVIDVVVATDADGDALEFSISTNDGDLFVINNAGELSLAAGKELDFETSTGHVIEVTVTDGVEVVTAEIQINVLNKIEGPGEDPNSFVTTWDILPSSPKLTIGKNLAYAYDFQIDWGDGTVEHITTDEPIQDIEHVYASAGVYTVSIGGDFPAISMYYSDEQSQKALVSIDHWGIIPWQSMFGAFTSCNNMEEYAAEDKPNLTNVISMEGMFADSSFDGAVGDWNVSNVQNMEGLFALAPNFDQDLGSWNIGSVSSMQNMLDGSGMSTTNYSNTLTGWAAQAAVPSGITLGAEGLEYCGNDAVFAWAFLDEAKGWTITGDSQCP